MLRMVLTKSTDPKTYRTTLCVSLNCSKCCTCHAKRMEGLEMLRLPHKTSQRGAKCSTCHAKRTGWAPIAAPATQTDAAPNAINRRRTCADLCEGAPSAAPAMQNEPEGLQVLHLPRKTSRRGSKCCACHANRSGAQCNQSLPDFRGPP